MGITKLTSDNMFLYLITSSSPRKNWAPPPKPSWTLTTRTLPNAPKIRACGLRRSCGTRRRYWHRIQEIGPKTIFLRLSKRKSRHGLAILNTWDSTWLRWVWSEANFRMYDKFCIICILRTGRCGIWSGRSIRQCVNQSGSGRAKDRPVRTRIHRIVVHQFCAAAAKVSGWWHEEHNPGEERFRVQTVCNIYLVYTSYYWIPIWTQKKFSIFIFHIISFFK